VGSRGGARRSIVLVMRGSCCAHPTHRHAIPATTWRPRDNDTRSQSRAQPRFTGRWRRRLLRLRHDGKKREARRPNAARRATIRAPTTHDGPHFGLWPRQRRQRTPASSRRMGRGVLGAHLTPNGSDTRTCSPAGGHGARITWAPRTRHGADEASMAALCMTEYEKSPKSRGLLLSWTQGTSHHRRAAWPAEAAAATSPPGAGAPPPTVTIDQRRALAEQTTPRKKKPGRGGGDEQQAAAHRPPLGPSGCRQGTQGPETTRPRTKADDEAATSTRAAADKNWPEPRRPGLGPCGLTGLAGAPMTPPP